MGPNGQTASLHFGTTHHRGGRDIDRFNPARPRSQCLGRRFLFGVHDGGSRKASQIIPRTRLSIELLGHRRVAFLTLDMTQIHTSHGHTLALQVGKVQ